jgi:SpoIID/LytB domain protein
VPKSSSDELNEITRQISDLTNSLNMSINATKPLESELKSLETQISNIKIRVASIEKDLEIKKKNIDNGYKNLAKQEQLLYRAIRDFYIKSYYNSPLLVFLSASSASHITQVLAYQKAATDQDKIIITNIALSIEDLETKKKNLEVEQERLTKVKTNLDIQSAKLDTIVQGAKSYQAVLSSQIAQLSSRQQQILAEKQASLNLPTSLGAGPLYCTDDRKIDPGFSPAFAFYTYGIPHRVGMNQYGAQGRANAGQSHEDILRSYFDNITFETRDSNTRIKVQGYGEYNLDDYVARIYEMPNSFHTEALKAQAIAARSYALSYTNNGEKEICTTQTCQVFKPDPKGGPWEQAVRATSGKVMINSGQVITAWYSSTDGGYTFTSSDVGWNSKPWTKRLRDTSGDISSFEDLQNNAYDKESPCFYSAQGFRKDYNKSAWLKGNEVADIVNVVLLARADSSIREHLYQLDKPNPAGTETWNEDKIKQELKNRGINPYSNVSDISVEWDKGTGQTTSIRVTGDGGGTTFDGSEFKNFFNLRAPANIQIVGPLYNVERR